MKDALRHNAAMAAFATAGITALAGLLRLSLLAPGLAAPDRQTGQQAWYITQNSGLWATGWLGQAAEVGALAVLVVMLTLLWARETLVRALLAMVALSAGVATSLMGFAIAITVMPRTTESGLPIAEGTVVLLHSGVGAGLIGVALALVLSSGARHLPWRLFVGSMALFVPTALLVVSTLVSSPRAMSAALLLQALGTIGWTAALGRELSGAWPLQGLLPARPATRGRRR